MNYPKTLFIAFAALTAVGVTSHAAPNLGVQFVGGGTALTAGQTAGVTAVQQDNWNAVTGSSGANLALLDEAGAASGVSLTFGSNGTYQQTPSGFANPANATLASGQIFGSVITPTAEVSVTFSGISAGLYDVYVYGVNDGGGRSTGFTLTPLAGTTVYAGFTSVTTGEWVQGTSSWNGTTPNPTLNAGNYVVFSGVSTSAFTLRVGNTANTTPNGALNAVQIVAVPEPGTVTLLGLSLGAVLFFRRRRMTTIG